MQGLLFPGDREVHVASFPDPMPGPGEGVVAMRALAICGSDLPGDLSPREARPPDGQGGIIPGHEPSGVIHSLGEGSPACASETASRFTSTAAVVGVSSVVPGG
jgi:L-iditol 2-dehydrogenase